jgi:hypothetical protein
MQVYENDILLLEWTADSAKTKIDDGVDAFVFKDGFIRAQTVHYTSGTVQFQRQTQRRRKGPSRSTDRQQRQSTRTKTHQYSYAF